MSRLMSVCVLLMAVGCGDKDSEGTDTDRDPSDTTTDTTTEPTDTTTEPTDTTTAPVDSDGDGFAEDEDCDDADASVYPGADELCDGIDSDCDDSIDEEPTDAPEWYLDVDEDGFGDTSATMAACEAPDGYVADNTDCDDSQAESYPGNEEVCDGLDNDCDGDADGGASDMSLWALDGDADGYGDASATLEACDAPEGYVADTTDCDDGVASIYPGADELCDDIDSDCDDSVDEEALDMVSWYSDSDNDGYGDADAETVSCDAPLRHVENDTDCDDTDRAVSPGEREVCDDGLDNDCDTVVDTFPCAGTISLSEAEVTFVSDDADDDAGAKVSMVGDVNGDGLADMLFGAPSPYGSVSTLGAAYLVLGSVTGEVNLSSADAIFIGESEGSQAGFSVSGAGDVDGDGLTDLLIGAIGEGDSGAAYLILSDGVAAPLSGEIDLADADAKFVGESSGADAGYSVSGAGDVNGDGYDDVLIGARGEGGTGAAYLFYGPITGELGLADADIRFLGEAVGDYASQSLSGVGDIDGDGLDDIMISAYGEASVGTGGGAVYLVTGATASASSGDFDLGDADVKILAESSLSYLGENVRGAGDVDADGLDDVVFAAPFSSAGAVYGGAAYLFSGANLSALSGDVSAADADARFTGEATAAFAGNAAAAGDMNGDGFDDILVGSWGESTADTYAGAVYVILGPVSGEMSLSDADIKLTGLDYFSSIGFAISGDGDVDGDGFDDFLVGSSYYEDAAGFLMFGGEF